ncbi:MAG: PHP domain-containing protein [Flexilinea sp.]|nr:PHP domain-containing protein [Flexilinea sp.]
MIKKIDLHMHTMISDGTDTPEEIITKVRDAGIDLFSVTDHDAFRACELIRDLLSEDDPAFITGIEFSCKDELGKYHVLGYGYDPSASAIRSIVKTGHEKRIEKLGLRLDLLRKKFNFVFSEEDIRSLFEYSSPGKPHIANLMVKYGYSESIRDAFDRFLNKASIPTVYIRPEQAIEAILLSGGIPVLAHPSYGSGDELIIGEEMDERLRRLIGSGLQGVEAYYSGFTPKLQEEILGLAEKYGLYVTAGSDYHGTNKLVVLGNNNLEDVSEGPEGLKRFLAEKALCAFSK